MPDTNNVRFSQENNSQSEKSKPEPPETPNIEFTRTYPATSDGVTREYLLKRKKQATATNTNNVRFSQDNDSQSEKSKPRLPETPNIEFTRTYPATSDGVTREYILKRKKEAKAAKNS